MDQQAEKSSSSLFFINLNGERFLLQMKMLRRRRAILRLKGPMLRVERRVIRQEANGSRLLLLLDGKTEQVDRPFQEIETDLLDQVMKDHREIIHREEEMT